MSGWWVVQWWSVVAGGGWWVVVHGGWWVSGVWGGVCGVGGVVLCVTADSACGFVCSCVCTIEQSEYHIGSIRICSQTG